MATWPFFFFKVISVTMLSRQSISKAHENKNESWYKGEKAAEK